MTQSHREPLTVLFTGGTRSGRSALALRWAESVATPRAFLATARVEDEETALRVARHQAQRGAGWSAWETPLDVVAGLEKARADGAGVAVVDCVTLWLSNLMARELPERDILDRVADLASWLGRAPLPVAVVTGELGMGMVALTPIGRAFCDVHGEANQMLASACRLGVLVCCGVPIAIKGCLPEGL